MPLKTELYKTFLKEFRSIPRRKTGLTVIPDSVQISARNQVSRIACLSKAQKLQ